MLAGFLLSEAQRSNQSARVSRAPLEGVNTKKGILVMDILLQQIINGLVLGSMYALIALGYTMVYGIINLINFAHGEVLMVGALTSWSIIGLMQESMPGTPGWLILLIALLIACVVAATLNFVIENRMPSSGEITNGLRTSIRTKCEAIRRGDVPEAREPSKTAMTPPTNNMMTLRMETIVGSAPSGP